MFIMNKCFYFRIFESSCNDPSTKPSKPGMTDNAILRTPQSHSLKFNPSLLSLSVKIGDCSFSNFSEPGVP